MQSEYVIVFVYYIVFLAGTEKTLVGTLASILAQLLAVLIIILIGEPVQEVATRSYCTMSCMSSCVCNGKIFDFQFSYFPSLRANVS